MINAATPIVESFVTFVSNTQQQYQLFHAIKNGNLAQVRELLKLPYVDPNALNDGPTPLILAIRERKNVRNTERARNSTNGRNSKTYLEIIKELIKSGADVDKENSARLIPLEFASSHEGDLEVVRELINAGADVNKDGGWMEAPLATAAAYRNLNIVRELIKAGAKKGIDSGLLDAAKNGDLEIIRELIKAGANVNVVSSGHHPLTLAIQHGCGAAVKELITARADVNQIGPFGESPLRLAKRQPYPTIAEELIKAGAVL